MIDLRFRRVSGLVPVCACLLVACGQDAVPTPAEPRARPWSHLNFRDPLRAFQFAVVADRAGGRRPGVFTKALEHLEALSPAFVISVGDLVETGDIGQDSGLSSTQAVEERWTELDVMVNSLSMPFFFVAGNNELRTAPMEEVWQRRLGRTYYHFVHDDVLFIVLNTEDPPGSPGGALSDAQVAWLRETLAENAHVRWTFVFLHRPMWLLPNHPSWALVEEALGDRARTVFGGHTHQYSRSEINGNVYYGLATTGGGSDLAGVAEGSFDHVVWVAVTEQGPRISNLMLDGILGDDPAAESGNRP